jgi:SAM-dependent methyltransferase
MINVSKNKQALIGAYALLAPYSDKARWEFNSHLCHLNWLTENVAKDARILDVGCGIGILILSLKLLGYDVEGYDKYVFRDNTSYAVHNLIGLQKIWERQGLRILAYDVFGGGLPATQYDVVVSIATVEHQSRPRAFLEHLRHSSAPGGIIYLSTPNVAHLLNRIRFLFGRPLLGNLRELFDTDVAFVGHFREYTLEELVWMFGWLDIEIIFAGQIQDKKPKWPHNFRGIYVNFFRTVAAIFPSLGETNIIIGRVR